MPDLARNPYDEVAYSGRALPQTHPDRLATLATLFGLQPPPISRSRVLELGCGDGANLIPMAWALPHARFLGIDLAARPLERGRAAIATLGLDNITLVQGDIGDPAAISGRFDYVIAHGLYSWVPPAVQDRVLAICSEHLAADGVAYVSYNVYPGGHLRDMVREMMRFHVRHLPDSSQSVEEARALLAFVAGAQPEGEAYGAVLATELERIRALDPGNLFHDDLAETNTPVYFHEFAGRAAAHALQFLAEADYHDMTDSRFAPEVAATLQHVAGEEIVLREQYADFLRCRKFRQTLLCHAGRPLARPPAAERLADLAAAAPLSFEAGESALASPTTEVSFRDPAGQAVTTDQPLLKAAFACLAEQWPRAVPFAELTERARDRIGQARRPERAHAGAQSSVLGEALLSAYGRRLVSLHRYAPRLAIAAGAKPTTSAVARLEARTGSTVTNLRHEPVVLDSELARRLVQLLDGTRDRSALLDALAAAVAGERTEIREVRARLAAELDEKLATLARLALLLA